MAGNNYPWDFTNQLNQMASDNQEDAIQKLLSASDTTPRETAFSWDDPHNVYVADANGNFTPGNPPVSALSAMQSGDLPVSKYNDLARSDALKAILASHDTAPRQTAIDPSRPGMIDVAGENGDFKNDGSGNVPWQTALQNGDIGPSTANFMHDNSVPAAPGLRDVFSQSDLNPPPAHRNLPPELRGMSGGGQSDDHPRPVDTGSPGGGPGIMGIFSSILGNVIRGATPGQQAQDPSIGAQEQPSQQPATESRDETDLRLQALKALTGEAGNIQQLQEQARQKMASNMLGRAANQFADTFIPGARGRPDPFFDKMDELAQKPLQDALLRQQYAAKGLSTAALFGKSSAQTQEALAHTQNYGAKTEQLLNDNDGESAGAVATRAFLVSQFPELAKIPGFDHMSPHQFAGMSPEIKGLIAQNMQSIMFKWKGDQNQKNRDNAADIAAGNQAANLAGANLRAKASAPYSAGVKENADTRANEFNQRLAQARNDFDFEPINPKVQPNLKIMEMVQKAKGGYQNVTDVAQRMIDRYKKHGSAYFGIGRVNSEYVEDVNALKIAINQLEANGAAITDGRAKMFKDQISDPTTARYVIDKPGFFGRMEELLENSKNNLYAKARGGNLAPRTHPLEDIPVNPIKTSDYAIGGSQSGSDAFSIDKVIEDAQKIKAGITHKPQGGSSVPETSQDSYPLNPPPGPPPPINTSSNIPTPSPEQSRSIGIKTRVEDPGFTLARDQNGAIVKVVGGKPAGPASPDDISYYKMYVANKGK